jgi:hypothetical protein
MESAGFAEDVAGVDHAKFFLRETTFVARVRVDGPEGETGERMAVFGGIGSGVAKGS